MNRLANETSPYLLQHRDNPVDWYPWGDEAFAKARAEDKPILLSVGYSSCHWCHVMAHESFEDEATAQRMNDWFVNIKVDREERPDVDGVYMTAVQAMTGSGGWPMTVFMTADARPFYAGTYFPPDDGHGRPGFPRVLETLNDAWRNDRAKLLASAEGITDHLRAAALRKPSGGTLDATQAATAVETLRTAFDEQWGGFGQAPKFPSPSNLEFLLTHHARAGEGSEPAPSAAQMALVTLVRMAQGGMYDHLGGGFARYSVDRFWLVPHFEKMLYDNAQLARVYLHAYQLTGEPFYERIVRETLRYLEREMRDPEGGFYSAQDADSEGIEGKFYLWTVDEVRSAVSDAEAALFCAFYGVDEKGNFQDPHHPEFGRRTVLAAWSDPEKVARDLQLSVDQMERLLDMIRGKLYAVRAQRVHPGLDDKVLTSWNGLVLGAFAEAGRVLRDTHYVDLAIQNAAFLRRWMWDGRRLVHSYKAGVAKIAGMLEDYAYTGLGLIELYRATGDLAHLAWARDLLGIIMERFRDQTDGAFFETAHDAEPLLLRQKEFFDGATPGSNGAVAMLAFWLGRYFGREDWLQVSRDVIAHTREMMERAPSGFGMLWQVAEYLLASRDELVVVGGPATRAPFAGAAAELFRPWLVYAPGVEGADLPLFEGRGPGAYLCHDMVCDLPALTPEALVRQLATLVERRHG